MTQTTTTKNDPFCSYPPKRHRIAVSLLILAIIIGSAYVTIRLAGAGIASVFCKVELLEQIPSPSGDYVASIYYSRCATVGRRRKISVQSNSVPFHREIGTEIFSTGSFLNTRIVWLDERHVQITWGCSSCTADMNRTNPRRWGLLRRGKVSYKFIQRNFLEETIEIGNEEI